MPDIKTIAVDKIVFPAEGSGVRPEPKEGDKDWPKVVEIQKDMEYRGQLQYPVVADNGNGTYTVIAGYTRVAAVKRSVAEGHPRFQDGITVSVSDIAEEDFLVTSFAENHHRRQTTKMQEIKALSHLILSGKKSIEQLSQVTGVPKERLTRLLKLTHLPENVQTLITDEKINLGNALYLQKLPEDLIVNDPMWIQNAQTMKGEEFGALVAKTLEEIRKQKQDKSKGEDGAKVFTPTASYMKKEDALTLLEQTRFDLEQAGENATEFQRGELSMIERIFGLDPETLERKEAEFIQEQERKKQNAQKRKEERERKKQEEAVTTAVKMGYTVINDKGKTVTLDAPESDSEAPEA